MEDKTIDCHFHVGIRGNGTYSQYGHMTDEYLDSLPCKVFQLFSGLSEKQLKDDNLIINATLKVISESKKISKVVCLALDQVYNENGNERARKPIYWVTNEFILLLQKFEQEKYPNQNKILFGASVHPYDKNFEKRVYECVRNNAVLMKWIPSAMGINLAHPKVKEALEFLATAKNGNPLPLLLHVGPEGAFPSSEPGTKSYDYISWSLWDKIENLFRSSSKKYKVPDLEKIHYNIQYGLAKGCKIIFAHCGLPYLAPSWFKAEHSDFKMVRKYIHRYNAKNSEIYGKCYADISAFSTPSRVSYFKHVKKLPKGSLIYGSDYPTPIFDISLNLKDIKEVFEEMLKGNFKRFIVPPGNLLDVNYKEMRKAFNSREDIFTTFNELI